MDGISFKELTEENLPAVLDVYTYYVLHTTATFHIGPLTPDEMKKLVLFDNPKYKTFLILQKDSVCGYVALARHKEREAFDPTAEIAIYLWPDCTGKGIGNAALTFIEEFAKSKGIHVLIATITGGNTKSIRLFEKNGYKKCAHYKEVGKKMGQWLDLVAYQKIIN